MQNKDKEIVPFTIDLTKGRRGELNESFLEMFGTGIKAILSRTFGGPEIPVLVRGSERDIKLFANTLQSEKKYMRAYQKYGLDSSATLENKYKLQQAIKEFERETNLLWPIK